MARTVAKRQIITPETKQSKPPPAVASPENAEFARRLHKALRAKNMSASDLAAAMWGRKDAMIGHKTASVARNRERISIYLAGRGRPREHHLVKMSEVLGMDPADLLPSHVPGPKLPPPVNLTMLPRHQARLTVDTVIPADLALRITQLIEKAQRAGDAD